VNRARAHPRHATSGASRMPTAPRCPILSCPSCRALRCVCAHRATWPRRTRVGEVRSQSRRSRPQTSTCLTCEILLFLDVPLPGHLQATATCGARAVLTVAVDLPPRRHTAVRGVAVSGQHVVPFVACGAVILRMRDASAAAIGGVNAEHGFERADCTSP